MKAGYFLAAYGLLVLGAVFGGLLYVPLVGYLIIGAAGAFPIVARIAWSIYTISEMKSFRSLEERYSINLLIPWICNIVAVLVAVWGFFGYSPLPLFLSRQENPSLIGGFFNPLTSPFLVISSAFIVMGIPHVHR